MPNFNSRTIAHLAVLAVNLIYAGGFSITKIIMPQLILPKGFILLRVLAATLLFYLYFLAKKLVGVQKQKSEKKIERKDLLRLALCALFGVAVNQLFFFEGLARTTPVHAALMMLTTPILVVILASFILREKFTWNKGLGITLGLIGAAVLISLGASSALGSNPALGDFYVFINAVSYSIYLVIVKPLMSKYSPLAVISWVFLFAIPMVLPFGYHEIWQIDWSMFTANSYWILAYVLIGMTFLAYLWNIFAMQELSPTVIGAYIYMQPFLAALIAILFFGEEMNWVKVVAGVFIFSGVYLVGKKKYVK